MPAGLRNVVDRLRSAAARHQVACGDLLDAFVAGRDEAAFAELVRRHGPRVYAVCRRVLGHHQLAEDAFQATFVVLARKAHAVRPRAAVGGFLYGVARRAALEAYAVSRRRKETLAARVPDTPAAAPAAVEADVLAMLDEEIAGLSDPLRAAVVLCELDGLSRAAAARQLGVAEGTLSSRLAAARKQLAARLTKRGVTLSAALFAAVAESAAAAPPLAASLGPTVAAIAAGVMRTMILAKLKAAAALAAVLVAFAAWSLVPTAAPTATAAPVPKDVPDDGLLWVHERKANRLVAYRPSLDVAVTLDLPADQTFLGLTPDGRQIVYAAGDPPTYHLRDLGRDTPGTDLGFDYSKWDQPPIWNRDGSRFVRGRNNSPKMVGVRNTVLDYTAFHVAEKQATELKIPSDHWVQCWAPDGAGYVTLSLREADNALLHATDGFAEPTPLPTNGDRVHPHRVTVSPDGKTLLVGGFTQTPPKEPWHQAVWTMDPATGATTQIAHEPGQGRTDAFWSPDGTRVVLLWGYAIDPKTADGWDQMRLSVARSDGGGRTTVTLRDKAKGENTYDVDLLGWFPTRHKITAPPPNAGADDGLIWTHNVRTDELKAYTPAGAEVRSVKLPAGVPFYGLSADGTKMAFGGTNGKGAKNGPGLTLHVGDIAAACTGTDTGVGCQGNDQFVFSPDRTHVVRVRGVPVGRGAYENTLFDLLPKADREPLLRDFRQALEKAAEAARQAGQVPPAAADDAQSLFLLASINREYDLLLPADHAVRQWAADGKSWLVSQSPTDRWFTAPVAHLPKLTPVCDAALYGLDPSPDGKTLLAPGRLRPDAGPGATAVLRIDRGTGTAREVKRADPHRLAGVCGSPDGQRVACVTHVHDAAGKGFNDAQLLLLDADGRNEKVIVTLPDDFAKTRLLGWFPAKQKVAAPVPQAAADDGLLWTADKKAAALIAYTPDGKVAKRLPLNDVKHFLGVTPDGTRIVFAGNSGKPAADDEKALTLHLRDLGESTAGKDLGVPYEPGDQFVFSPDKTKVVRSRVAELEIVDDKRYHVFENRLFDLTAKTDGKIELPKDAQVVRWAADGKSWQAIQNNVGRDPKLPNYRWLTVPVAGGRPTPVNDDYSLLWMEPSPDGKTVLATGWPHPFQKPGLKWFNVTAATGQFTEVARFEKAAFVIPRWSPDGKRVAYARYDYDPATGVLHDTSLFTCRPDGTDSRPVAAFPNDGQNTTFLGWFPATPASDCDTLQGRWKLVESDDSGGVAKANGFTKNTLTVAGDTLSIAHDRDEPAPPLPFRLDETTTPKRIDFQTAGKKSPQDRLGVYKLDGDRLTVCSSTVVPVRPDLRPTDFTITATNGRLLSVYERMKDDDPRWVAEWFAGHTLAGRADVVSDVWAADDEQSRLQKAGQFKGLIVGTAVKCPTVWADATAGRAIAVSNTVKLSKPQPDGTDTGQLVFTLVKAKTGWRIRDVDVRPAKQATAAVDTFRRKNPTATEAKPSDKP